MKPSAYMLDWLRNTFEGQDHVLVERERRKFRRATRKMNAMRARIDAAHAHVDNWLNVLHAHEDPVGVWVRDNDTRHDYMETAD